MCCSVSFQLMGMASLPNFEVFLKENIPFINMQSYEKRPQIDSKRFSLLF